MDVTSQICDFYSEKTCKHQRQDNNAQKAMFRLHARVYHFEYILSGHIITEGCEVHVTDRITSCDNFHSVSGLNVESSEGDKISALLCLEIGGLNSVEPLVLGAETSLPVVDCDGMGRAFPELQVRLYYEREKRMEVNLMNRKAFILW